MSESITLRTEADPGNIVSVREVLRDMEGAWRLASAMAFASARAEQPSKKDQGIALAKIVCGAELGFGPGASVRGIHFIQGNISLSADLMVACARNAGWDFDIKHSSPLGESCTVKAMRDGYTPYEFTYTIDMAKKAGLLGKGGGWNTNPWDMLYARAASHVCRKIVPDRLMGIYTPEEAKGIEPAPVDTGAPLPGVAGLLERIGVSEPEVIEEGGDE